MPRTASLTFVFLFASCAAFAADYDLDGVDNAEEFLHQCDPLTKDTDGDGLTDREEIDGAIAGMAGFGCDKSLFPPNFERWLARLPLEFRSSFRESAVGRVLRARRFCP